jgi:hypothetical protein
MRKDQQDGQDWISLPSILFILSEDLAWQG